uniref:Uncharacterized protein n=1 Tax=Anguilla anguilla TaxID=7936 RepID=A0A0E9WCD6_ANGAN
MHRCSHYQSVTGNSADSGSHTYLSWIQILLRALPILPGVIQPANMTRRWGLHFFLKSISLVPIHQTRSV